MSNVVTCPTCQTEIQITKVMEAQISTQIRAQLQAELNSQRAAIEAEKQDVAAKRNAVEEQRQTIDDQVRAGIAAECERLGEEAAARAREDLSVEMREQTQRLNDLQTKLKESQANELTLRRRERELQDRAEELQLEVARQLDAERVKIRGDALRQFEEQHQLKDAEKELRIVELRKQIDVLKRKAEQGSQQTQGEVQELALEELLRAAFPTDSIGSVPKGICGGDTLQTVHDGTGHDSGRILWESKRTKNWSSAWLPKLREDQRTARASCAVVVSEALPDGVRNFALVDGVWVCSWPCVTGLAMAIRVGLIEVSKSRLAVQGQHEKMELVYNYLSSPEFQHRIAGVAEVFVSLQADLGSERRCMTRIWAKREKQLQRALTNTASMYGDLQGIIGASLPEINGLTLPELEWDSTAETPLLELAELKE